MNIKKDLKYMWNMAQEFKKLFWKIVSTKGWKSLKPNDLEKHHKKAIIADIYTCGLDLSDFKDNVIVDRLYTLWICQID